MTDRKGDTSVYIRRNLTNWVKNYSMVFTVLLFWVLLILNILFLCIQYKKIRAYNPAWLFIVYWILNLTIGIFVFNDTVNWTYEGFIYLLICLDLFGIVFAMISTSNRVGQREALRNGYDTCIFLNEMGKVAEGPGSCFFMVKGSKLITPCLTDSVLESITRDTVIKIAGDLGIDVEERSIDRTELYTCDEAFLCGSAMEITPVYSIDKQVIGDCVGEMTDTLHEKYLCAVLGNYSDNTQWVTAIYDCLGEMI